MAAEAEAAREARAKVNTFISTNTIHYIVFLKISEKNAGANAIWASMIFTQNEWSLFIRYRQQILILQILKNEFIYSYLHYKIINKKLFTVNSELIVMKIVFTCLLSSTSNLDLTKDSVAVVDLTYPIWN